MLDITPIGSCRIAGPLQRGADRYGFVVNKSRSYGYCHSSGEAVQMAQFIRGLFTPPSDLWPLLSRRADSLDRAPFQPDLAVVELSSAKRLTVDGVFIQLNYFTSQFQEFLSDKPRAEAFWALATAGDQPKMDQFLEGHHLGPDVIGLLRRVRLEMTTPEQLCRDIQTLQTLLPRIFLVTHVDAIKPDGRVIQTRSAFIDMVKTAAADCRVDVYDPTHRMIAFGQTAAIADHSDSLAHYTDGFSDVVVADLVDLCIAPTIDQLVVDGDALRVRDTIMPHAVCVSEAGYAKSLHQRVTALRTARPDLDELDLIDADLRDLRDQAVAVFDPDQGRSDDIGTALLMAVELDRFDAIPAMLVGPVPAWSLLQTAEAALAADHLSVAVALLSHVLRQDMDHVVAAQRLAQLVEAAPQDIPDDMRKALVPHVPAMTMLRLDWAFDVQALPVDEIAEVVQHYVRADDPMHAAAALLDWHRVQPEPTRVPALLDILCEAVPVSDCTLEVSAHFQRLLAIDPRHQAARRRLQDLRQMLRDQMQAAVAAKDPVALDALAPVNMSLPAPVKDLDLHRARLRFETGDYQAAREAGQLALACYPESPSLWMLLMRCAVKHDDASEAQRCAQRVIALCEGTHERFTAEARRYVGQEVGAA